MSEELVQSPRKAGCRKCYARIPEDSKFCPECGTPKKYDTVPIIFVILLLASSLLLMSSSYVTTKQIAGEKERPATTTFAVAKPHVTEPPPPPKDISQSAYQAAKGFAKERFPNAIRVSELSESRVAKSGDMVEVTLFLDTADNGNSVRNVMLVRLQQDRGNWRLKEIAQ